MIINQQNLSSLTTTFKANFKKGFGGVTPTWTQIATAINSTSSSNLYAWLGQFPQMREWLGDRVIKNMAAHDYTLVNKDFESTVGVARNDILDDNHGVFGTIFESMGFNAASHPDEVVYELLAAGASNLCYDGQNFFDTDHPTFTAGVASTASNYDATGGGDLWALLDTKRPLKPMIFQTRAPYKLETMNTNTDESVFMRKEYRYGVDARVVPGFGFWQMAYGSLNTLNATNMDAAWTAMAELKSDEGRPLGVVPNLLVCGESNRTAARDLINTKLIGGGNTNPLYQAVKVLVSPHMP